MDHISKFTKLPNMDENKKPRSKWNELVFLFLEELNVDRGEFPSVEAGQLVMLLKHIVGVDEKERFYKWCKASKNFSKRFWWSLEPSRTRWSRHVKRTAKP